MRDLWHFPRPEDAERIVSTLVIGLVWAMAIIEPRRRGKTTFLQDDLAPAARQAGFIPIYINLAASSGDLEQLIVAMIEAAIAENDGLAARLRKLGSTRVKKLAGRASLATAELGGEVEFDPGAGSTGQLNALFGQLAKLKEPILFLLDEVHKLADDTHRDVAWSLRSLLDSHRKSMKVVATSSSAASYEVLVSGEKKAFKTWFSRVQLTPLGDDFIDHLLGVVKTHFPKHPIARAELAQAFAELGRSPKFIRDYLNERILNPLATHQAALQKTADEAAKDSGFDEEFDRLSPLQKKILFDLAGGQKALFGEAALKEYGKALGAPEVSKSLVQRAVNSLATKGWLIKQERGDYRLADHLFEQWLGEQIRTGRLRGPLPGD